MWACISLLPASCSWTILLAALLRVPSRVLQDGACLWLQYWVCWSTQQEMRSWYTHASQMALGSWFPAGSQMSPEKQLLFFYFLWAGYSSVSFPLLSPCSLLSSLLCPPMCVCFCLCQKSCVYMHTFCLLSLTYTLTHVHTFSCPFSSPLRLPHPTPPQEYLDPAAGASGDTKDTTVPRSGPSSPPELILHSQSLQQSLVPPPPTWGGRNFLTLGLRAACSKQMPACEDSHQSSHTEADCAGSLFHSNKGTSAEHCRLVQTEPAGAQREVKRRRGGHQGAPSQRREQRSGFGMKPHSQGHILDVIPGSPAILASPASHAKGQWLS